MKRAFVDSDSRLGSAIRQLALEPAAADRTLRLTIVSGDWIATYEVRVISIKTKPQPKRVGGVLAIHPKRSAPGKGPR